MVFCGNNLADGENERVIDKEVCDNETDAGEIFNIDAEFDLISVWLCELAVVFVKGGDTVLEGNGEVSIEVNTVLVRCSFKVLLACATIDVLLMGGSV